jgi:hypothetical protein
MHKGPSTRTEIHIIFVTLTNKFPKNFVSNPITDCHRLQTQRVEPKNAALTLSHLRLNVTWFSYFVDQLAVLTASK